MTANDYGCMCVEENVNNASREDLISYLENRGFAVYEHETTAELLEAVELDMDMLFP